MPALIIQTNEDGTVSIAAPQQIPPELLADAEQVASLDEAAQIVKDVLGADQAGEQPAGPDMVAPASEAPPVADEEAAMEQGFRNVRGAPR